VILPGWRLRWRLKAAMTRGMNTLIYSAGASVLGLHHVEQMEHDLYIGVTNDLVQRVVQHKQRKDPKSFTARYHLDRLVWFEPHNDIRAAIAREKQLKNWKRDWKDELIDAMNKERRDLSDDLI